MHDAIHPHGANVLALINNEESFHAYPDGRYLLLHWPSTPVGIRRAISDESMLCWGAASLSDFGDCLTRAWAWASGVGLLYGETFLANIVESQHQYKY
jgi:hypothetical protein